MRAFKIVLCVLLALLIAGGCIYFLRDDIMADVFVRLGDNAAEKGDEAAAYEWYQKAFDRDYSNYELCQTVALKYAADGNYTQAEKALYYGINASPDHTNLYLTLSSVYTMQDKLLDASVLLDSITDPEARAGVNAVRPSTPVLSHESGEYNEYVTVTVDCDDTAACFITLDGTYPSVSGEAYTHGITLPEGETVFTAVAVNENGIVSSMVRNTYSVSDVIEPVVFNDPLIESVVRKALSKEAGLEVISSEIWELESLKITHWDGQITDYSDLHWFRRIPSLILEGQENIDYEALLGFDDLRYLMLKNCGVTTQELEILAQIESLETLDLTDNSVAGLSRIVDMPNLKNLVLAENSVSDLTPVGEMTGLEKLDLRENAVSDISALEGLRSLKYLDLEDNLVSDLTPVEGSSLTYLNVTRCPIGDITCVGSLLNLEEFRADYCEIYDISALATCSGLIKLSMSNNQVTDLTAISGLSKLEYADLSENLLSGGTSLASMKALKELRLSYNGFTTVASFANMPALEILDLDHNQLQSVAGLSSCPKLKKLYCFGNSVEDANELEGIVIYG